jgi:protoporphyrinogen oxidase
MIYDYIIIGSGISGLYLGYLLQNKKYLIFEKNDNIGGRIQYTNFHGNNVQLGAGIIKKNQVNILELLKKLKLKYITVNKEHDTLIPNYNKEEYNHILDKIKNNKNTINQSMKDTIRKVLKNDNKKINLFIKSFGYTDYLKADTNLTIKYYPINDFYDTKSKIHIIEGGNHKIIETLATYSDKKIKLNSGITSIDKHNDVWIITDENNNTYQTKHIISTVDIKALKKIKINGLESKENINYFIKMIGTNNFLRMYTYHDNIELNKSIVIPHIFKQMIPINNNIIMSAYCDNSNAIKTKKLLQNINNKKITEIINNYISTSPVKDKIIKYWDVGTHYYKPSYNYKKNYYSEDNFSIVGEVIGYEQGWMEGAIHSVNNWFKNN